MSSSKAVAANSAQSSTLSIEQYQSKIRPFFNAQFARLDRLINKRGGAKQDTSESKQVKLFVIEAISALVESVGNRKEEERILRSVLVHYDGYFNTAAAGKGSDEETA